MSLKIIGTGMGRTGTHSLKLALEELGFGKCYHMAELFNHPEELIHFEKAEKGEDADWDTLFEGYQSAVDYPVTRYYKQLMKKYPDAKMIHTYREPESWYQSASQTIIWASKPSFGRILKMMLKLPFSPGLRKQMPILKFNGKLIESEFGKDYKNKDSVIDFYNRHNEDVLQTVPKEKLLVFDPKQGWAPLCNFLGVPVPQTPFPQTNKRDEFISRIKNIKGKIEI
ncbi:MAG: sulfotransferase family protein [Panacibacter sp.]